VSVAPIPPPFDQLGRTPFSFYPPIVDIEHNEWLFRRATWSEIQVMNTKTSSELWVPRRFIGELSLVGEPVMIVGLVKELEYKAGIVCPHVRHVIEMPRAVNDFPRPYARTPELERPAPVVGIRLETGAKTRMMLGAVAAGILACVGTMIVFRDGSMGPRATFSTATDVKLPFTARDDYDSIVNRLGPPAEDRWQADYRRLWYPQQSMSLVLRGHEHARYIGAVDAEGRVIHSVELPGGRSSAPLLKNLR
jgi:hypothetical protein